jgi:hypothetical protein
LPAHTILLLRTLGSPFGSSLASLNGLSNSSLAGGVDTSRPTTGPLSEDAMVSLWASSRIEKPWAGCRNKLVFRLVSAEYNYRLDDRF